MEDMSDAKPLVSLCNDYDHYVRCLDQFFTNTAGLEDFKKWVNTSLGQNVLEKLDISLPEGETLRTLGVGSGNGQVEYNLISRILTKHPRIKSTVVEPSKAQLKRYKNLVETNQAKLDGVEYEWRGQTLSEYRLSSEESGDETKFHFISALLCLYYEPEMDSLLSYLYDRLAPGGVLLTSLESASCDLVKIEKRFQFAQDDLNPLISDSDILASFERHGIPTTVYHQPNVWQDFDVTACFQDGSQEGALLLDFLSCVIDFRNSVSQTTLKEFRDYLKTLATVKDEKVFLYYDTYYIMGWKNKNI